MTIMRTIQDDVNALAMHVLDVTDYASGIKAEAEDAITTAVDKLKAEMEQVFNDKLDAFRKEIMGDVETEASKAVADLGAKVAGLGKPVAAPVSDKPADPAPQSEAPAQEAPVAPLASDAPVSSTAPSGASVIVDPKLGTTTHETEDGTATIVPHDGSPVMAMKDGEEVAPVPEHVAEAINATAEAGVALPPPAATPEAAPVI